MSEAPTSGTVRDVLAVPAFRRVYLASFVSNAGRWMQTAATGVLAWEITESSTYLGLVIFAQLGPLGILSLLGGSLADTANRKRLLVATQLWQVFWTFVLALAVADGDIDRWTLLALIFVIGLGQGLYAPAFTSVIPSLAGPQNLQAAIAANSAQVNGARVIGPAIGGWMTANLGFAEVFAVNGFTYVFVITAIIVTPIPDSVSTSRSFSDRIFGGFRIASRAPQVGRPLLLMSAFSFFCLPFLGQLPAIAELNLNVDAQSSTYGWFYAAFGCGALCGALLVGTALLRVPRPLVARVALTGFAGALAWLAVTTDITVGYFAVFTVGLFYFLLPTTLSTSWQEHVDESVRGRVAALWILSFGGTVPFANIAAGPIVEATSLKTVLFFGAAMALVLAVAVRLRQGPIVGEEILDT